MISKITVWVGVVFFVGAVYAFSHLFSSEEGSQKRPAVVSNSLPYENGQSKSEKNHDLSENPVASYKSTPGMLGRIALDEIYSRGVPQNKQSIISVRALLAQGVTSDEKVSLARILGSLYRADDSLGENENILMELRRLANDPSNEVVRSAVISYARLGYLKDSESLLYAAYARDALGTDDYYGELAHLVDIAPARDKIGLTEKIKNSANSYASDILAMSLIGGQEGAKNYPVDSLSNISQIFRKTEPEFSYGMGEFGLMTAMRYANWLRANAVIENQMSGKDVDVAIIEILSQPKTDPRKVLSFFLIPESTPLIESASIGSPSAGLVKIALQYANQFPGNPMLQEYARDIAARGKSHSK